MSHEEAQTSLCNTGKEFYSDEVNIKFLVITVMELLEQMEPENQFLKILSGEEILTLSKVYLETVSGWLFKSNHYAFDKFTVFEIRLSKSTSCGKSHEVLPFMPKISLKQMVLKQLELEAEFAEMDGWNAESMPQPILRL